MVRSVIAVALAAILLTSGNVAAQERPDLSGTWQMEVSRSDQEQAFHGQRLIIKQSESLVRLDAQWTDQTGRTQFLPWDLRINRWGPRRGGDHSKQPLVQARWDGRKLIMLKAPGEGSSALWILSLADGGDELVIETISMRNLGESTFRESSIPKEYARLRFIFRKIA